MNVTPATLMRSLSSENFDLIDFIPSNLSLEENEQARSMISEFSKSFTGHMRSFLDLYGDKKDIQDQITTLQNKIKPGCFTYILSIFAAYILSGIAIMPIMLIAFGFESKYPSLTNFLFIVGMILFVVFWVLFTKKVAKSTIKKKDLANLASMQERFASLQSQVAEVIKNLGYTPEANEDGIFNDICVTSENFSKVIDLLEKRDIILRDQSLSPSACLLAIEQLYNVLRQEKHNKEMQEATLKAASNAADRIASEVARQEETNRMVSAFLAGFLKNR